MRRLIFLCSFFFIVLSCFSQKEGNIWYFGNLAGVDFNSGSPVPIYSSAMNTGHGCACISDRCSGRILFYTDGTNVWDSTHNQMPNGNGLLGDKLSTQSAIIVPPPDTASSEYFVFTVMASGSGGLNYSIVDMKLNGGKGDVVSTKKNLPLISPTVEKLTAVKHINNKDVWVISHELNSNAFYAYLITTAGLNTNPVISKTGNVYDANAIKGYLKASPDGKHLAAALRNDNTFDLFEFDNSTGIVSNGYRFANTYPGAYGVEFSPDGSKLYATINSNGLYQLDLNAGSSLDIANSEVLISTVPSVALQLGPDGKIYTNEGRFLGAINDPNTAGAACNYVTKAVSLGSAVFGNSGLPTFLQSYFSPIAIIEKNICLGSQTTFSVSNLEQIDSLSWDFGEPASGTANTSKLLNPVHEYLAQGTYTVKLIYYGSICGGAVADTITSDITIIDLPAPSVDLGPDTVICPGEKVDFAAGNPQSGYLWQDGSQDSVFSTTSSGKVWVTVNNSCGTASDTAQVSDYVSQLSVDLGKDTSFCKGNSLVLDVTHFEAIDYLWSDGSQNPTNFIATGGSYWVTLSDRCFSVSDTITVGMLSPPDIDLGNDTLLCPGDILELDATTEKAEYKWQDGSKLPTFRVDKEGRYYVSISNRCGSNRSIIDVAYEDCSCSVFVPTAFTPNGDNLNNRLRVSYDCNLVEYELSIYSRWGELVYYTNNPDASWDGTLNGATLPQGAYIYHIVYHGVNHEWSKRRDRYGTITMIK